MRNQRSLWSLERHELKNFTQMTKYEIMVSAVNKAGSNNSSTIVMETDPAPPQKPSNLTLLKATSTTIVIQWSPPPQVPLGIKVCYQVGVKTVTDSWKYLAPECNNTKNEMEIKALKSNTTYVVSLYASIERPRDKHVLDGESIERVFTTGKLFIVFKLLIIAFEENLTRESPYVNMSKAFRILFRSHTHNQSFTKILRLHRFSAPSPDKAMLWV